MGEITAQEFMNLVEGYAALMKQAERGDATEEQCSEIWETIRRIAVMFEASTKKAKRLEDALRGMLEAHLLEDYSNSGHYLDLCGQAWMKARDVLGEECDGVVTPNAEVWGRRSVASSGPTRPTCSAAGAATEGENNERS